MTNESVRPGLQPLSQLKSSPTVSNPSSTSSTSSAQLQVQPRPSFRISDSRKPAPIRSGQVADEKATASLIRRVLCPGTGVQPLEELLPPLTSSNEVDRQLYALLAIIIRDFVYSWYSQITSDHALVSEGLQVLAHCSRALEQRLRQTDIAQLVLDELPALVESHIVCKKRREC